MKIIKKSCFAVLVLLALTFVRATAAEQSAVQMSDATVTIPTYGFGEPEKNPIFYNGRKYQGAKGPVYPYPMLDALSDVREDAKYQALSLENKFVRISVLPALGGRLYTGLDKTDNYDFFYRNRVIKPALVGMAGAWLSGGVEWNFPHHHRVTTCMAVDSRLVENPDGGKTIWVGEIELRHRMKWLVGLTVYPDRSYVEITTKMINRTPFAHSMLYFANAAVHANGNYQVIFPPKTQYGTYHSKYQFVNWPVGRGMFNGLDRSGVDLSWWKNQPSPNSIFAWNYEEDFLGGYDHGKQAGVVHVADHHVVPGKKFFTWGAGEEGYTWDRVLTDGDGPYIEFMTGAYSDNQPDYSWLQPYETRIVRDYWYPIRDLGGIKNANRNAAVNLELGCGGAVRIAVNTTSKRRDARVVLAAAGKTLCERKADISPAEPFVYETNIEPGLKIEDLRLAVFAGDKELIAYQAAKRDDAPLPEPATPPPAPKEIKTCDELNQIGRRLEQFHNGALEPYPYYQESLKRDPGNSQANIALGILYCKRGMYARAENHLRTAVDRLGKRYTTLKDAEPLYYLGMALRGQGKFDAADDAFHKCRWSFAWRAAGCYALAENACRGGDYAGAWEFADYSLETNSLDVKALTLKGVALRKLGRREEAAAAIRAAQKLDPMDFWSGFEKHLLAAAEGDSSGAGRALEEFTRLARGNVQSYLETAADYAACGAWDETIAVLTRFVDVSLDKKRVNPLVYYNLAFACEKKGDVEAAKRYWKSAAAMPRDYCFPFRLETIGVLRRAATVNPKDAGAYYYLGNLLYDIQPQEAVTAWEKSRKLDPEFPTVHRNLGLAYARIQNDYAKGAESLRKAFLMNTGDAVVLAEYEQTAESAGIDPAERLALFDKNAATSAKRDDARLAHVNLCVQLGRYDRALELLSNRHFRRWEGEHGPYATYVDANLLRGREHFAAGRFAEAEKRFLAALEYPDNFETGRPLKGGEKAAETYWFLGLTAEAMGRPDEAERRFQQVVTARLDAPAMRYYLALARKKLGDEPAAERIYEELIAGGSEDLETLKKGPQFNFFAIFGGHPSLTKQTADAHYIIGLGLLGKGQEEKAKEEFRQAVSLNPSHIDAKTFLRLPALER